MTQISAQPYRIPLVDPKTGLITREWARFLTDIFNRVGGSNGQTNDELAVDMHDDSGIEEIKLDAFRMRDEFGQLPPGADIPPEVDDNGRLQALEAAVSALQQEIEAIRQGTTL